ncbi:unnamed protein product [Cochlearia groenlandica]
MEVSTSSLSSKQEQNMQNPPPIISSHHHHNHHHDQHLTTFVQADTSTFKQVVQMLTGGSSTDTTTVKHHDQAPSPVNNNNKGSFSIPPIKKTNSFKLYERRQNNNNNNNNMFVKNDLMINTLRLQNTQRLLFTGGNNTHQSPRFSPRNNLSSSTEINSIVLSPSMLNFPKLGLNSPVTPLRSNDDPFNKSSPLSLSSEEEDKAIAEKGFYLHPSPRDSKPLLLLPLFPTNP